MMTLNKYKTHITAVLMLGLTVLILFFTNAPKGTMLSGWDNIHSEFGPYMNFVTKSIYGIWQESYGLGANLANATATEMIRIPIYTLLTFFVTPASSRYLWHFIMLFVGSVGMYFFIHSVLKLRPLQSFCGAFFYMLNLGTVQNFYLPVEGFSYFYAVLPWMLISCMSYLQTKSGLLTVFIMFFIASPSFYFPTTFVVFLLVLAGFLGPYVFDNNRRLQALSIFLLLFIANSYWLLPFSEYVFSGKSRIVSESQINQRFTEDAVLRNASRGSIYNVLTMKGLWFDTNDVESGDHYENIMRVWEKHLKTPLNLSIELVFLSLLILGYLYLLFYTNSMDKHLRISILLLTPLVFVGLATTNWPTGVLFTFLQNNMPFFRQIFRLSFTKLIVLWSFIYTCLVVLGLVFITKKLSSRRITLIFWCFLVLTLIFSVPSFQGNFVYKNLKVTYPQEYFNLFNFFKSQDKNTRIASFPQINGSGWYYYNWGYRGSGFAWYGIEQPILERTFDVWNDKNEQYYNEVSYALYSKDIRQLEKVFEKYNVTWVWLDSNQINIDNPSLIYATELERLLRLSTNFSLVFSDGNQKVWKYNLSNSSSNYIRLSYDPILVTDIVKKFPYDVIYSAKNDYILSQKGRVYPFLDLVDTAEINADSVKFSAISNVAGLIKYPNLENSSISIPTSFKIATTAAGSKIEFVPNFPTVLVNNREIPTSISYFLDIKNLFNSNTAYFLGLNNNFMSLTPGTNFKEILNGTLNTGSNLNTLVLFSVRHTTYNYDLKTIFSSDLENCGDSALSVDSKFSKSVNYIENSVSISGRGVAPCLFLDSGIKKGTSNISILRLNFAYKASNNSDVCLYDKVLGVCVSKINLSTAKEWKDFNSNMLIPSSIQDNLVLRFFTEKSLVDMNLFSVKNLSLSLYEDLLYSTKFKYSDLQRGPNPATENEVNINVGDKLSVVVKTLQKMSIIASDLATTEFQKCSAEATGIVKKTFSETPNFIDYYAKDSSICDTQSITDEFANLGMINMLTVENIAGRAFSYCVKVDPPGYCMISDIPSLQKGGKTEKIYLVPPFMSDTGAKYSIFLNNYSVGENDIRTNRFYSSVFYNIPARWISGLYIERLNKPMVTIGSPILNSQKLAPFLYDVSGRNLLNRAVVLNQSFDNDWIIIGPGLKDHTLVNSWTNGWYIDTNEYFRVFIIYWPQLLVYVGFIVIFTTFILLSKKRDL